MFLYRYITLINPFYILILDYNTKYSVPLAYILSANSEACLSYDYLEVVNSKWEYPLIQTIVAGKVFERRTNVVRGIAYHTYLTCP